ncbi:hypothetical protein AVEN_155344-1 [Araneus ventricosus]|uniref:Uncharacterized protein n=1 Tax=Araneus ventricosus TaxID=182803 RepID=A0A4Y2CG26_ARAVE|nr:hypothetical protein AVEN_155344-1 [Araneus ventricosus]
MSMQPATLFTICAVQTVLRIDTRRGLYFLHIPRTVLLTLLGWFEVSRCLKYHGDLPLSIYFDAEMNREIALPDFNHGCDELFDWAGEIMENILHFNDWSSPDILPRDVYAYLMSRTTVYRHFFREELAHVVMEYVTRYSNFGPTLRLCLEFYQTDDTREAQQYAYRKKHAEIIWSELISFLQQRSMWCSNCVRTPLFRLFGPSACRGFTNLHRGVVSSIFWTECRNSLLFDHRIRTQVRVDANIFPEPESDTDSD